MSDVSTTQVVFVPTGERSILSVGGIAVSERLDANTSVIGAGGNQIVVLCIVSRTKRVIHRMAQDEQSAPEELAWVHQDEQVRDAVIGSVGLVSVYETGRVYQ